MKYTNIPVVHLRIVKEKEVEYGGWEMDSPEKAADLVRPLLDGMDREWPKIFFISVGFTPASVNMVEIYPDAVKSEVILDE